MKKVLSLVLALSMVLGSFGMAFAAPETNFTDVKDDAVVEAVNRLEAFGIVHGYEDGSFRPDQEISREEFAKLLVEALGLERAAQAAMGSTNFTDVAADRWSSGYINVAAGQQIVLGNPDGTFRPSSTVTYAEALTMLVRALGYQDEWLPGSWPGNFVSKAAELGIDDDIKIATSGNANRGAAAVMINNTLDVEIVEQRTYGGVGQSDWIITDEKLFENRLDISKLEDVVVYNVPKVNSGLNEDEVELAEFNKDSELNVIDTFEVIMDNFDYNKMFGLTVDAYINDDDELFYYELQEKEFNVHYDVIDAEDSFDDGDEMLELIRFDNDLDIHEDEFRLFVNNRLESSNRNRSVDALEKMLEKDGDLFAKIVTNRNNKVVFVEVYEWEAAADNMVVVDVDVKNEIIEFFEDDGDNVDEYDLSDEGDIYFIYDIEGNVMELKDIEKNDVFYIANEESESTGDDELYVFVVRDTVEGEMTRYRDDEIRIDKDDYDTTDRTTVTLDNGDTIELLSDNDSALEDITDEDGEVVVLLDAAGKARHIISDVEEATSTQYGLIVRTDRGLDDRVRIFTEEEEEVNYYVDGDLHRDIDVRGDIEAFLVEYEINSAGEVEEEIVVLAEVKRDGKVVEVDPADYYDGNFDKDFKDYEVKSETTKDFGRSRLDSKLVRNNAPVFNLKDYLEDDFDTDDIEVITWKDVIDEDPDEIDYVALLDENRVSAVFIADGLDTTGDDVYVGYALDTYRRSGDQYIEIDVYGEGIKEYEVDNRTLESEIRGKEEFVIIFQTNNDGDIKKGEVLAGKSLEDGDDDVFTILRKVEVEDKDGTILTLKEVEYDVASKVVIYDEDDAKRLYNVREGDKIDVVVDESNGEVLVISILDEDAGSDKPTGDVLEDAFRYDGDTFLVIDGDEYVYTGRLNITDLEDMIGEEVEYSSRTIRDEEVITSIKLVEVEEEEEEEEEDKEPVEISAEATVSEPMFGARLVDITVEGVEQEEVDSVKINGSVVNHDIDGEFLSIIFEGDVESIEITVEGKDFPVVIK